MHDKIRKYAFMLREDGEREEMMRVKLCDHEESSDGGRVLCDAANAAEEAIAIAERVRLYPFLYRVTHHVVSNLPLTSKQKFRLAWSGKNGTYVLKSP